MNEPIKTEDTDIMSIYQKSDNILSDIQNIIETSQRQAYHAVDTILSQRNWLIGYRISEEEIDGSDRAEYGANIIKKLSKELTAQYGKGYDRSNLYHCLRFYKEFPQIVDTTCRQSHMKNCEKKSKYKKLCFIYSRKKSEVSKCTVKKIN